MGSSCLAAEWPPTPLVGAWLVDSTSVDDHPDVERGSLVLLLIAEHLVLAESFPGNTMFPYAVAFRVSDGKLDVDGYTALLHVPAVGPSCFSVGHGNTVADATFTITAIGGNDRLTVELKDLKLKAERLGHAAATNRIQSVLREADLECEETVRKFLAEYVASQSKSSTDEPCAPTEPRMQDSTGGEPTVPAR